jgi:CRP-like cAMP-binding protein
LSEGTTAAEVAARLREVPFLTDLPGEVIDTIRRRGTLRRLARGEPLFARGEMARGLLVVIRGSVRIYQIGDTGREHVLHVNDPGSSVAELPLFDGGPYPAHGEASEESVIFTLAREHFQALLREHPELAEQVIRALAQRLRRLVQTVEGLALKEVDRSSLYHSATSRSRRSSARPARSSRAQYTASPTTA